MPAVIAEKQLSEIWRHQKIRPAGLMTGDGQKVTVLYPGRLNDGRGGDFRDAIVLVDGQKLYGDIELHVRSADWVGHGHHRDAAYNRVVLHVVWQDTGATTTLQNGTAVPVLALHRYTLADDSAPTGHPVSTHHSPYKPCQSEITRRDYESLTSILDKAGEARFKVNTELFSHRISGTGPGQALYEGIMTALGYAKNKLPFQELARRLPLHTIEAFLGSHADRPWNIYEKLNNLMLQVAGFLPVASGENITPMSDGNWDLFKVRPVNSPVVRIGAAARLLTRYRETHILHGLLGLVDNVPSLCTEAFLRKGLLVEGIGRQRVDDIIVNVLLPFTYAFGPVDNRQSLANIALKLFREYGRLASNCLERHMITQIGLPPEIVNTARRQQGLIHIYKTLCTQDRCDACALAQP